jgi:hypothetical protein
MALGLEALAGSDLESVFLVGKTAKALTLAISGNISRITLVASVPLTHIAVVAHSSACTFSVGFNRRYTKTLERYSG